MYACGGLSRSKGCARRPAQLPGGLNGIQTHTFRELSDPGRGLMVARVPGVACLRARRLAHGLSGRDKLGEGHPGTPAPRHPGTPAPRHPGTPAPRHPGTPAPRHPGTPAPRHPGTPAPRHPGTPARLERRRFGGLSRPFPVRVVGELAAALDSCFRKAGGLQFSNGGAAARAAGRSRFRLWGARRPASPPPRESVGTRRRSGSIGRAALPPAQGSLARAAGAALLGLALMAGSAAAQDTTAPTPGTATVVATRLQIAFNEQLDGSSRPAASAFAVTLGASSVSVTVATVQIVNVTSGMTTTSNVNLWLRVAPIPNERVDVTYTAPATNPLQDSSSNKVVGFSKTNLMTSTGWSSAATTSVVATGSGEILTLEFDADLAFVSGNAHGRFTVTQSGTDRTADRTGKSGTDTLVLFGISPKLVKGQAITVTYRTAYPAALEDVTRLQDSDDGLIAAFSGKAVTNRVAEALQSAVIVGKDLTLTYSGTLGTSQVPLKGDYTVNIGGVARTPTSVVVSGSTVALRVIQAYAATSGDAVEVSYQSNPHDTTKWLKDADGRVVGSFSNFEVTNNTKPLVAHAEVVGDSLVLTYDGPLLATQVPAASAFDVTVGTAAAANPSAVAVDGSNLELTLSSAVGATDAVKVTYTKPATNPLQGTNSVAVDAFSDQVANNTSRLLVHNSRQGTSSVGWTNDHAQAFTTGSSAFKLTRVDLLMGRASSVMDGTYAVKILNATADGLPGTALGTLTNPSALPVNEVARAEHTASGDGIDLAADTTYYVEMDVTSGSLHLTGTTTSNAEEPGAAPGWSLADSAAGRGSAQTSYPADPFVNYALRIAIHGYSTDNTAPLLNNANVAGAVLTLTYNETLDPNSTPAATAFDVTVGTAAAVNPTAVQVTGTKVYLTLGTAVTSGQTVELDYTQPSSNPIRDVAAPHYNKAAALSSKSVGNITGSTTPEVTAVAITSDPGSDNTYAAGDTISVGVTFDETVNVVTTSGTPRLKIKLDPSFGELWAEYSSGHGTATLTFNYTVVSPNVSTQGIAVLVNTLELNGGTITAVGDGSTALLAHQGLAHNSGHLVDASAPQLAFAAVRGSTLTLTFNESLDENSQPSGSSFNVSAKGSDGQSNLIPGVNTATVEGATVKVALTYGPAQGDTLKVSYALPATGKLRDAFGNEVAAFSARHTANNSGQAQASVTLVSNTGQTHPSADGFTTAHDYGLSFTTGSVTGGYMLTSVQIDFVAGTAAPTYSVEIYDQSAGLPSSSLGTLNNPTALVDGLNLFEVSGTGIELDASTTYWVVVDVTTAGTGTIVRDTDSSGEDAGGAPGWSLADSTNYRANSATTWTGSSSVSVRLSVHGYLRGAPTLSSTTVNGAKVRLTYDQALDTTSTPAASDFTVTVAGSARSLAGTNPVVVSGKAVTLTLASAVTAGQAVTVSYTPGTNPVRSLGGTDAVTLAARAVVNETPAVVVPPPPVNPPPVTPGDTPGGTPSSGGSSRPPREPVPLQLALWTERPAYRAGETVRLYRTIRPHDDRLRYRTFVYLERADGEERRYLAPLAASHELHPDPVDLRGMPADLARARTLEAADRELAFEGEPPGPGLWQFVMELRPGGPDDQFERLDEPLLTRRAWAKFTVAERTQLLNRRGFDREVRDDLTFSSDTLYILGHQLFVNDGATLTIEAGTVVRAFGAHTAIIVEPGGRIVAEGTREAPVVLTCSAPVGQREPGCWAGLRILGKAPVTRLEGVVPGVLPAERAVYGAIDAHVRSAMLFDEGESEVSGALLWNIGSPLLRNGIRDSVDFSVRNPKLRDVRYFANPDPRPKLVMSTFTFERENYIGAFGWDKNWIEEWTVFGPESVYDLRERDAEEN